MKSSKQHTAFIKNEATRLGFQYCGISKAMQLEDDARRLENWLNKGMHGSMMYMENYFDLRIDPVKLVPGAKSVITFMLNYFQEVQQAENTPNISKYAFGKDYHEIIKGKLNALLYEMRTHIGEINGRGFVDSAPVLERSWAQRSGAGFIGKNGNLIHKQSGSFFFLATLITDLELEHDDPVVKDYCGTCTRCIDHCPTEAILPGKVVDGSKCISYFTIELKDEFIPETMKGRFKNWMFGCDICQDVCPWNRFAKPTQENQFIPIPEVINLTTAQWENLSEDSFKEIFRHSPIKRSKWKGIQRNLKFIQAEY